METSSVTPPENTITVHIKTPKTKESVQTAPNASVKEFKELVSQKFNARSDKICLIFSGRILKDEDTLNQLDITDGLTVSVHSIFITRSSLLTPQKVTHALFTVGTGLSFSCNVSSYINDYML